MSSENRNEESITKVERGLRFDLVIAVCALLISSLAAGASWWQARVMQRQTIVLQEQLGAQVWPYVTTSTGFNGDAVRIDVSNDGLGPAVLWSFSGYVDGVQKSSSMAILHALLGDHLVARSPRGEKLGFSIDSAQPGAVIRPGEAKAGFALRSSRYARQLMQGTRRLTFRICYCAIIPGKCWLSDASATREPKPVGACPEIQNDLLHEPAVDEITSRDF